MATFYQGATKSINSLESVLHGIYKKIGKGKDFQLSGELIEKSCGSKKDISEMLCNIMNTSMDCVKILKVGCAEVDELKSESKGTLKELT